MSNPTGKGLTAPRFQPGVSGNPGGLAKGTRNKLNGAFLKALSSDFDTHGAKAIRDAREQDPVAYMKVVASLLPKQIEKASPFEDMEDAELLAAIDDLRARLAAGSGAGAGPTH